MICKHCKLAADIPEFEGWRHSDCINLTQMNDNAITTRETPINGCFCQHHPVGTRQIIKTEEND